MHFADFCQFVFNRVCRDLKHPAPYNLFQTAKRFQGTGIIISQVKRNQEQFQALRLRNSRQFFFHTKAQRVQMFFQAGRSGGLSLRCSFLWHPFPIYPPTPPPPPTLALSVPRLLPPPMPPPGRPQSRRGGMRQCCGSPARTSAGRRRRRSGRSWMACAPPRTPSGRSAGRGSPPRPPAVGGRAGWVR